MPEMHWRGHFLIPTADAQFRARVLHSVVSYLRLMENVTGASSGGLGIRLMIEDDPDSPRGMFVHATWFGTDRAEFLEKTIERDVQNLINNTLIPPEPPRPPKSVWQWLQENPYK
jgi:hypothetical protein